MSKVPTAEEFIALYPRSVMQKEQLIEFAKLHVQAALEAAVKKAKIVDDVSAWSGQVYDDGPLPQIVDPESILKAYPSKHIK